MVKMNQQACMMELGFSQKAKRTRPQPIGYLISAALDNPGLANLAAGLVDPVTLPVKESAGLLATILGETQRGRTALQYDSTGGHKPLQKRLLQHLEELDGLEAGGLGVEASQILVTTGSQQALYMIGDCLIDPGDIVITESPSYFVYTGTLDSLGATLVGVPMDDDGMRMDALEALLEEMSQDGRLSRLKMIYCTSYYQNPTGLSLAAARRPKLVELARKYSRDQRILILEDAAYRELRYDGDALPSIKRFDPDNEFTALTQTFSKPFAPGIKLGYTAMPADLAEAVLRQKGNHDFGSSSLCQQIALEAMNSGLYHRHVKELCDAYRIKRDATVDAVRKYLVGTDPTIRYVQPHGGLYVWVTLPQDINTSQDGPLFAACLRHGMLYVPGDYCFGGANPPTNGVRLSFGQVNPEEIDRGVRRLSEALAEIRGS